MNRILFLNAVISSPVLQGSDGDHMKIYIWQGLVVSDEYRQRLLLRWQQGRIPTRLNLAIAARLAIALNPIEKQNLAFDIFKPHRISV